MIVEHLKPEARKNILGVEAQVWSETIKGRDMLEYYTLPKLIGFAESAWAPERDWETIEDRVERETHHSKGMECLCQYPGKKRITPVELPESVDTTTGFLPRVQLLRMEC